MNATVESSFKQGKVLAPKAIVPNAIDVQEVRKHNLEVRGKAYKAVRRPGKSNLSLSYYVMRHLLLILSL